MLQVSMLRALKGCPLSVIIALFLINQPVTEKHLITVTGYSPNSVRTACLYLQEIQAIGRISRYGGYHLMDGFQMILSEGQKLTLPITTTTTFNKKEQLNSEENNAVAVKRTSKIDARLNLLYAAGVMEPTSSSLLDLSWVTEDYLKAHIDKSKKDEISVGLLIHRIRCHDPQPKIKTFQDTVQSYRNSWLGNS